MADVLTCSMDSFSKCLFLPGFISFCPELNHAQVYSPLAVNPDQGTEGGRDMLSLVIISPCSQFQIRPVSTPRHNNQISPTQRNPKLLSPAPRLFLRGLLLYHSPERLHAALAHRPVVRPGGLAQLGNRRDGIRGGQAHGARTIAGAHGLEECGTLGRQLLGHGGILLVAGAVGEAVLRGWDLRAGAGVLDGAV